MGYGDEMIGAGIARACATRGKRAAFGDGKRIIWGPQAGDIYRGNPHVARPGFETSFDLEWVRHYPGHRAYNRKAEDRWVWNYEFQSTPGEIFFDDAEQELADNTKPGFVLIEPNVLWRKSVAPNKQWSAERFQAVADNLIADGHRVLQLEYGGKYRLKDVEHIATKKFRDALAVLSRAALFIGPEGGMHHGAAALGVKAVVIFGGFIPPQVTGYDFHVNLTGGAEACGSMHRCDHCAKALDAISVEEVLEAARGQLPA